MSQPNNPENNSGNQEQPFVFSYTKDHPEDYPKMSDNESYRHEHHSSGESHHHHHHSSDESEHHHHSSGSSEHHHHHSSSESSGGSSSRRSSGSSSGSSHSHLGSSSHHRSSGSSSDGSHSRSGSSSKPAENKKIVELSEKYAGNNDKQAQIKEIQKRIDKSNKKNKTAKIILGIFLSIFLLIVIAAVSLLIMMQMGKKRLLDYDDAVIETVDDAETEDDGKIIYYKGNKYKLNENITSIACLGVDKQEIDQHGIVGSAGQADTIMVVAFDTATGLAKIIAIPRDTIGEIDVYDKDGDFIRNEQTQICLAFAYGDGGKTSCSNVVSSIQKVMFGIPIKSYAALDLAGISVLNDAVGGVTVTPEESFAKFTAGQTVTLHGMDAVTFVRSRDTSKLDSNINRMSHQMTYVKAFTSVTVKKATSDISIVNDLYNTAMDYSYTDISLGKALYLATRFLSTQNKDFATVSVPGKMVEGDDGYAEYIIDQTKFFEELLSVYYNVIGTY